MEAPQCCTCKRRKEVPEENIEEGKEKSQKEERSAEDKI
jgi:hypothetical protein